FCKSTVAPSGTSTNFTTSDGCAWSFIADIKYSSQRAPIPHMTWVNKECGTSTTQGCWKSNLHSDYHIRFWNGAEYLAGSGGEAATIAFVNHQGPAAYEIGSYTNNCAGFSSHCPGIYLEAAPGEGFANNYTTSTAIAGYDATKGVAIRTTLNS